MNTTVFLLEAICLLFIASVECEEIVCPKQVTVIEGGMATIKCFYSKIPAANKHARKYFCEQGGHFGYCKKVIISDRGTPAAKFLDRATMTDKPEDGTITITLSQLQKSDEGTYLCGIGTDQNRIKAVIGLAVTDALAITVESKLIYSELRSTVSFQCKSDTKQMNFCKISKRSCKIIIDNLGKVDSDYVGRVTIKTDKQDPRKSYITLARLQIQDAGYYSCGVGKTTYDVRINEETDIPWNSGLLTPRQGGSLSAQCNYDRRKSFREHLWCRWKDGSCTPIISTDGKVKDTYEGRIVMYDYPSVGIVQVLLSNISKEDEGWYWSVLSDGIHKHICNLQVQVSNANYEGMSGNNIIQVFVGDAVKIPCTYPCRFKSYEVSWCKWNNAGCKTITSKAEDRDGQSLSCVPQEFMLNFESVSLKDNGIYWCGVKKAGKYVDTISVQLIVEERHGIQRSNEDPRNIEVDAPRDNNNNNTTVIAASLSMCVAVVVALTIFILRNRRRNHSDLVSVGSYRTNISMTDVYNSIGKENPLETVLQESSATNPKDVPVEKENKKESKEELDYSSFLIHQGRGLNEQEII